MHWRMTGRASTCGSAPRRRRLAAADLTPEFLKHRAKTWTTRCVWLLVLCLEGLDSVALLRARVAGRLGPGMA
jgi:hypothetical protein